MNDTPNPPIGDQLVRQIVVSLTALAIVAVITDAPTPPRVIVVSLFVLLAPGLAAGRFVPNLGWVDQVALAGAMSLSLTIVVSLVVAAFEQWTGDQTLAVLAGLTLLLALAPRHRPRRRPHGTG